MARESSSPVAGPRRTKKADTDIVIRHSITSPKSGQDQLPMSHNPARQGWGGNTSKARAALIQPREYFLGATISPGVV